MDIFQILTMIGGLSLFLYGMNVMGDSLSKLSGGKLQSVLRKLTSSKWKGLLLGAFVTAIIQSSSATTVMVVGFVNAGIMELSQSVGIIMGANIGTTITSWLLSLTGISGSNVFIKLLKPSSFSPILAVIGVILTMTAKGNDKKKDIGSILLGFAVLMFGMETMSSSVKHLSGNEAFTSILTMFKNPILGMFAGAVLTAVIQSSSASVGILQALCMTGAISFGSAIPIIMGQNIGTCITAILSSVGASKNAKRASMVHLYFNLIGTIVFMTIFYTLNAFFKFMFLDQMIGPVEIAIIHSLFNVGCAITLFPFSNLLVKLSDLTIRDKKKPVVVSSIPIELMVLDDRFLETPGFAMNESKSAAICMARETKRCISLAADTLRSYNEERGTEIRALEDLLDIYEDHIGSYLMKLSSKDLTRKDSRMLSIILHCTSDLERISDISLNMLSSVKELYDHNESFSSQAMAEMDVLLQAVEDIVEKTVEAFSFEDLEKAKEIEPLREVISSLNVKLRQRHIKRLRENLCTIELGIVLEDLITDLERITEHCGNIGVCLLEVHEDGFEPHEYVNAVLKKTEAYEVEVTRLKEVYMLP